MFIKNLGHMIKMAAMPIYGKIGETLDSVSTVFNEIAQHPPHTLFAVCNWSIGYPR